MKHKELSETDKQTKCFIRNAFVSNILGVSMQYSPDKYKKLSKMIKYSTVSSGCDIFRVSTK